jgi:membrane-bound serine protease (ClpP class)
MDKADEAKADAVVFTLRTPGGLVDSTHTIITRILSARSPVVVFVGPSGARAASAGFLITIAADVAAMAPGTHIGAAHPVSGGGATMDETTSKKAASDVAAEARSIATKRHRNVELVDQAVKESRAYTDHEASTAKPPLVDLVVPDVNRLLQELDGRTITRFDGTTHVMRTANARLERVEMSTRQRILSAIAHPQVAYLLLSLGTLGLTIELWSPGAILPGVVGVVCLLLAFFAFQVLPVNYVALLLIVFGLILLVLEVKITSFGVLGIGGVISLLFGSMILVDSPQPELQVGLQMAVPVTIALAGIILVLARMVVTAQRTRAVTGMAGMIDEIGRALTPIPAHGSGRVATRGEIWNATAAEPIGEGSTVRVVGMNGLTLQVRPEPTGAQEGTVT